MSKPRTRRVRITGGFIETKATWVDPTLTFKDYSGKDVLEVVLNVRDPWTVAYIRRELDKITAYWKEKAAL